MKGETTYNKYKRESNRFKKVISWDLQNFLINCSRKEFDKRFRYIKECIIKYRSVEEKKE